jgi:hypothetical protein
VSDAGGRLDLSGISRSHVVVHVLNVLAVEVVLPQKVIVLDADVAPVEVVFFG